jgi:hypothetical protein
MLFCECVSVNKKQNSKAYSSHIIQIFLDRSIHHGRIFFDKKECHEANSPNNEIICFVDTQQ